MSNAVQTAVEAVVDDPRFTNLINAAREFIAERIHTIEQNVYNDYSHEDLASAKREEALIEAEVRLLNQIGQSAPPTAQTLIDSQEAALQWLIDNRRPELSREATIHQLRRSLSHDQALVATLDAMHQASSSIASSV